MNKKGKEELIKYIGVFLYEDILKKKCDVIDPFYYLFDLCRGDPSARYNSAFSAYIYYSHLWAYFDNGCKLSLGRAADMLIQYLIMTDYTYEYLHPTHPEHRLQLRAAKSASQIYKDIKKEITELTKTKSTLSR